MYAGQRTCKVGHVYICEHCGPPKVNRIAKVQVHRHNLTNYFDTLLRGVRNSRLHQRCSACHIPFGRAVCRSYSKCTPGSGHAKLAMYIYAVAIYKKEPRNEKEKCCPWDSNQGPLVQHACITAHDTCLWHVGRLSNIYTNLTTLWK